jgi:hypothetical protein
MVLFRMVIATRGRSGKDGLEVLGRCGGPPRLPPRYPCGHPLFDQTKAEADAAEH